MKKNIDLLMICMIGSAFATFGPDSIGPFNMPFIFGYLTAKACDLYVDRSNEKDLQQTKKGYEL